MTARKLEDMFKELTTKARQSDKRVTSQMVEDWVGNHGYGDLQYKWMSTVLEQLASGAYTTQELAEDIIAYADMNPKAIPAMA